MNNRYLTIIFSLLLLWVGSAYGFSAFCCCATAAGTSMERTNDSAIGFRVASANCFSSCKDCNGESDLSFGCAGEIASLPISLFESPSSGYHPLTLPAAVIDYHELRQGSRSIGGQSSFFRPNLADLFLETCTFLS